MQRYNLFFNWPNLFSKIFSRSLFFTRHFCGCKGTTFFSIDQIFFKKNFSLFRCARSFWKRVQKYNLFLKLPNLFLKIFFWSILMNSLPFRKRVQKYNFFLNWQNISTRIFELFFKWLIISIPLTPEVDKNLIPSSSEGGTGGEEISRKWLFGSLSYYFLFP